MVEVNPKQKTRSDESRKIGVFGVHDDGLDRFSWPKEDKNTTTALDHQIFDDTSYVTKIVFKTDSNGYFNYIQFFYSNDSESPVI